MIGSPIQPLRLLPSTSGNAIYPILSGACPASEPSDCGEKRASFFNPNASSTWAEIGIYELLLIEEESLGLAANGSFGIDNVVLGLPGGSNAVALDHTVVGAFEDTSIYLGTIGLYPPAVNLSNITNPRPSFMGALRNQSKIPSTVWSYTAGANYRQPTAFGSLTLGGYDTARFIPNNLSFSFGPDQSRDLLVGLQGIRSDGHSLLPNGIYVFLDSLIPELWLPFEACQRFEEVFGLSYNITAQRYFVNATQHGKMIANNPNFTFTLGPSSSGGPSVDIVMQYGSLDLSYEDVNSGYQSRYFPLRQAQNSSMYTLGRTFFQDAYVIADYDRANFSVSQTVFPNSSNTQNIIAIRPPSAAVANTGRSLTTGGIAGVTIGTVVFVLVVCVSLYFWRRSRQQHNTKRNAEGKGSEKPFTFEKSELSGNPSRNELKTSYHTMAELGNVGIVPLELADTDRGYLAEMHAREEVGAELCDSRTMGAESPGNEYSDSHGG